MASLDKLDMSLEDITKVDTGSSEGNARKGGGKGRNGNRGGGKRGGMRSQNGGGGGGGNADAEGGGYQNPLSRDNEMDLPSASWDEERSSGPVRRNKGNNSARSSPYSRNSQRGAEGTWQRGEALNSPQRETRPATKKIPRVITTTSNKVLVTNLDSEVTTEDVEEIFEQAGAIKSVSIKTDASGRSMGTAEVVFSKRGTAADVVKDFDGAEVDGRPMYLRLLESAGPVVKRVGVEREDRVERRAERGERTLYVPKRSSFGRGNESFGRVNRGSGKESLFGSKLGAPDDDDYGSFSSGRRNGNGNGNGSTGSRRGRSGGRGNGRGGNGSKGRGGRGGRAKQPEATEEQLNADMDSYFNQNKAMADE